MPSHRTAPPRLAAGPVETLHLRRLEQSQMAACTLHSAMLCPPFLYTHKHAHIRMSISTHTSLHAHTHTHTHTSTHTHGCQYTNTHTHTHTLIPRNLPAGY